MSRRVKMDYTGRQCSKCRAFLPWEEFPKAKNCLNGYDCTCKQCLNFKRRTRYKDNKENKLVYGEKLVPAVQPKKNDDFYWLKTAGEIREVGPIRSVTLEKNTLGHPY